MIKKIISIVYYDLRQALGMLYDATNGSIKEELEDWKVDNIYVNRTVNDENGFSSSQADSLLSGNLLLLN